MITITIAIIAITCLLSFNAFSNSKMMDELIFHPPAITHNKQWYRFITCGFVHADIMHLAFNMFTLYFFGKSWETVYINYLGVEKYWYLIFYFSALIVSEIPSYLKNRNNYNYYSLGASGAVSAIVFSMILLMPWSTLYVFVFPIPAIVYAFLYIGYSIYIGKKGGDNVNHDAHLWGAIYGVIFSVALKPEVLGYFLNQLANPSFNF
ncbi:MAG: rhomboid family intramembrane serine protease [Chitinophagaceae bacterium]